MKKILVYLLVVSFSISVFSQEKKAPEKPKGYFSNFTLKVSYALGRLKLIDTDFPLPESIKEYKDLTYKTIDNSDLKLDLYRKKSIDKPTPLIIFIHGGAWKKGDKHDYWPYLIPYAEKGYITATIQYRLTGTAIFPAQLEDVEDAVKWLQENAAEYHIDKNKIALVGGSAGGHLAMLAAYSDPSLNIKAVVNLYGPSDLTTPYAREVESVQKLIGQTYQEAPELYKKASPITYISKDIPPTLTFQGTLDELVPYSQSDNLDKRIKEAGATSYYHKLKGWPHSMDISKKVNAYCQYYMDEFFKKYL